MKSKFDEYTKAELEEIIKNCNSIREVIKKIGLCGNGQGSYSTFHRKIKKLEIDISDLNKRAEAKRLNSFKLNIKKEISLSKILKENSNYSRTHLKKRLFKEKLIENKCSICGQLPMWNKKPLVLELDHINGTNNDNRIENLRIVCGHCHSQLSTTGSKRLKKNKLIQVKIKSINEKELSNIEKVKTSNIDFSKFGWVQKVANLINKKPQKINKWMKKHIPEILETAFSKKIRSW